MGFEEGCRHLFAGLKAKGGLEELCTWGCVCAQGKQGWEERSRVFSGVQKEAVSAGELWETSCPRPGAFVHSNPLIHATCLCAHLLSTPSVCQGQALFSKAELRSSGAFPRGSRPPRGPPRHTARVRRALKVPPYATCSTWK